MSWHDCCLGDVLTLKRGHDLPSTTRVDGSVPVVSSSGITGYHNEAKAHGPGVVTGRYGTLGEVFYVEEDYWPLNTALYVVDFKGTNPRFAAYFLKAILRNYQSDKAAVPGIDRNVLHQLAVRAPDGDTQLRIVSRLAVYDDLIENNDRRMVLLQEAAGRVYKEWFVQLRFPGHEHVSVTDGVPTGWTWLTLGDVAATNANSYGKGDLPDTISYVDIASVTEGRILTKTPMSVAEAPGRARRIAKDGDTIWSNVRPNLRAFALVLDPEQNDVFSTGFTVLSPKTVPFTFLYQFVTTDSFVAHLVNHTTGASYPAVRPPDFERASILVPTPALLAQFHELVEPSYRLIAVLEKENRTLAQARDLLLPKLMSGELAA